VPALVQERADRSIALAHDENRVLAHVGLNETSPLGQLALGSKEQPGLPEHPLKFELIDISIRVDPRIQKASLGIYRRKIEHSSLLGPDG